MKKIFEQQQLEKNAISKYDKNILTHLMGGLHGVKIQKENEEIESNGSEKQSE